jgi:hypothetical protein
MEKEPTRSDLEQEAKELGIQFDSSLSDGGLMLRIAQWYARKAYEKRDQALKRGTK